MFLFHQNIQKTILLLLSLLCDLLSDWFSTKRFSYWENFRSLQSLDLKKNKTDFCFTWYLQLKNLILRDWWNGLVYIYIYIFISFFERSLYWNSKELWLSNVDLEEKINFLEDQQQKLARDTLCVFCGSSSN